MRKRQFSSGIEYIHRRQKYHPLKRQNLYSPILLRRECLPTRGDEEKDIVREGGRVRSIVSCKSSLFFFCLSFSHLVITSFFLFVLTELRTALATQLLLEKTHNLRCGSHRKAKNKRSKLPLIWPEERKSLLCVPQLIVSIQKKTGDPSKKRKKSAPQFQMKQIKEWLCHYSFLYFTPHVQKKRKRGYEGSS